MSGAIGLFGGVFGDSLDFIRGLLGEDGFRFLIFVVVVIALLAVLTGLRRFYIWFGGPS